MCNSCITVLAESRRGTKPYGDRTSTLHTLLDNLTNGCLEVEVEVLWCALLPMEPHKSLHALKTLHAWGICNAQARALLLRAKLYFLKQIASN